MADPDIPDIETNGESWGEILRTIVYALLIALVFRVFLFQPFNIPSGSMKPTLLVGDFLFVSKYSYGYSRYSLPFSPPLFEGRIWSGDPERGDVIVFRNTMNDKEDFIKRLVGLPGDTIEVRQGRFILNGVEVERRRDGDFIHVFDHSPGRQRCDAERQRRTAEGWICRADQYVETLPDGGPSYTILESSRSNANDNFGPVTVPEGHYFFMGDNRDDSNDSRTGHNGRRGLAFVPAQNLVGRAEILFLSAEGSVFLPWNWRFDRIFNAIK